MFWRRPYATSAPSWSCARGRTGGIEHTLTGHRVRLVPVHPSRLFHLMDDVVIEGQGLIANRRNPFGSSRASALPGLQIEFGICEQGSTMPLGSVGLTIQHRDTATLGYWMGAKGRGRGLTSEAAQLTTLLALGHLGMHRVVADLAVSNHASRIVAEHAGLVMVGSGSNTRPNGKTFETLLFERCDGPVPNATPCALSYAYKQFPPFVRESATDR
jgi:RimJ/RimL family protein N-acetyltransferase